MSDPFSTPAGLDPEAGFTAAPSVSQAATDLRVAAGELKAAAAEKAREVVHTATSQATAFKDKAIESAQHLKEVATEKAQQFKATATEKADTFKHVATDKAQHLKETATEQWNDTRVRAKELHVTAEDYIRQNPTKSVLGALGIGFVVGLILRR